MAKQYVTHSRLLELLNYDEKTGLFYRKERTSNRIQVGDVAGAIRPDGYVKISLENKNYLAHRLAWFYVHGQWPKNQIDHINHVRKDNRISNIRDVTASHNQHNQQQAHSRNKSSGLLGVTWDARKQKWLAQIGVFGASRHIGYFLTPEDAHKAYLDKKSKLHAPVP